MNEPKLSDKISMLLQTASIYAVVSAFLGFLIVNIYLSLFGFWDFNFLKVQYFSAGTLFLFEVSIPAILFYIFFRAEGILERYREDKKTKLKTFLVPVGKIIIFSFIFVTSLLIFMLPFTLSNVAIIPPFLVFTGITWTTLILLLTRTLMKSHKEIKELRDSRLTLENIVQYFHAHFRFLYVLFIIPLLVLGFTLVVFPSVPRYLGGGKPTAVQVGFEKAYDNKSVGLSNPFDAFLIYQSTDSLLVVTDAGTYLLKQDDISYVKYLETNKRFTTLPLINLLATTTTP